MESDPPLDQYLGLDQVDDQVSIAAEEGGGLTARDVPNDDIADEGNIYTGGEERIKSASCC